MSEETDLGTSMVQSLRSDAAVSIASDAIELAIDSALKDGLLKDIPIIGTLVSVGKLGMSMRDIVFAKKIVKFLACLREISPEERNTMADKLEADPNYGRKVGEHLIEILERQDSHRKPYMTGKVFSSYTRGHIDALTLHRLNSLIDSLPFFEIERVRGVIEAVQSEDRPLKLKPFDTETILSLERAGALSVDTNMSGAGLEPTTSVLKFLELELDRTPT